jgi:hypothetical protein
MSASRIGEMFARRSHDANVDRETQRLWRRSYDVDDARAQVSTIYWEPSPKKVNFHRFQDVYRDTIEAYSDHVREHGKTLPISQNALRVLKALFSVMDGKTGRCDPCLDTIAKRSRLSRRTVVRQLETLRSTKIINWVRRTVKTGNAKGEGPQRQQTSNAYFIDMVKLPIEIVRTLRQKLGDKLRETARHLEGSGGVPNRMAIKAERLLKSVTTPSRRTVDANTPKDGSSRAVRRTRAWHTCTAATLTQCASTRKC